MTGSSRPPVSASAAARDWIADGPVQLPDRVIDAVLDEIRATPQRRGRLASFRRSVPMRFASRMGGVAVLAVVAVAIGVLVLLRQPAGVAAPAPTTVESAAPPSANPSAGSSPASSVASTAAPSASVAAASPSAAVGGFGTGPLAAGTYSSAVFNPITTLTLPAGWTRRIDDPELLWLSKGTTDLAFHFMATDVSPDGVANAMGFAKGAGSLPTPPEAVQFGSVNGYSAIFPGIGTGVETLFFKPGLNPYDMARGTRAKSWVLDGGRAVTVSLVAPEAEFDAAVAEADAILESLRFGR